MGEFRVEPQNEIQTREWFVAHLGDFDYNIEGSQGAYPDYVLSDGSGKTITAEAEYQSSNFIAHGHDANTCELIICWIHTRSMPLPVLELSTGVLHPAEAPATEKTKYPERPAQEGLLNRKQEIKKAAASLTDEFRRFTAAFVLDLAAHSEYTQLMTKPRLVLLAATDDLRRAMSDKGVDVGSLHPYDLWRLLN